MALSNRFVSVTSLVPFIFDDVINSEAIRMEYGSKQIKTESVRVEEERIRHKGAVTGSQCIELDSSKVVSNGVNTTSIMIKTSYPHWSDIERYRREHNIY